MSLDAYRLLRPLIFRLSPETAHNLTFKGGRIAKGIPGAMALLEGLCQAGISSRAMDACGLHFPSPIGLGAGLDKGAEVLPLWKALGFGSVEIGTVTPKPQPGNPLPRLFRLPEESLILNRMGFNSEGAEVVAQRLKRRPKGLIVGGNIGKNKVTPEEKALDDYREAYRLIAPEVDYIALNISSPNTPGLRRLQAPEALAPLLGGMMQIRKEMGLESQPILVKLAPDLDGEELDAIVDVIAASGLSGIIATNTTLDRGIVSDINRDKVLSWGDGGLSGKGLKLKAREVQRRILQRIPPHLKLVACGGIGSAEDAKAAMQDGAAWVQVYSALIFEGPFLVRRMLKGM
ncbi:quinone-dependent dihydroorotate dehydrogenase [Holophaga foetida]|uniref:quinone-dependent dihydroorotate dehydrogenase n=1 Tax=Holophaga foetida TaxID=35839 RepID=UPI0002473ABA|nr:quinone-dependent dihydroorotate dehydrogenase [Holophaga foetida]